MDPDPNLTIRGASSMRRIDNLFKYISPATHQVRIDVNTPLLEACDIDAQMQAGIRGPDAFQVYNPELVRLKVEATRAIWRALARMDTSKIKVCMKIDRTRRKIAELEEKIRILEEQIAMGAQQTPRPIGAGAVEHEQVIYTTWVEKPEVAVGPERQMPEEVQLQLNQGESASQLAFWKLNSKALKAKEKALFEFLRALCDAAADFQSSVFYERTRVGSGNSDYTFSY